MSRGQDEGPYGPTVLPFKKKRQRFELEKFASIQAEIDDSALVEGAFDLAGLSVIYGPSNSGKTFWAMDIALHIAAGRLWRGLRVQPTPVLYLALEGGRGAVNRIVAWRNRFAAGDIPFWLVRSQCNLLDPDAETETVKTACNKIEGLAGRKPGLIVVDTLARAMAGGNENSPEDMGAVVGNADTIRDHTEGALWFIHHSGKDEARGARGHSSLRAATDTEIEINASDSGHRVAKATKQREMEMAGEWGFRLEVETLANPPGRRPVTSCTVEQLDGDRPTRRPKPAGQPGLAYDILMDVVAVCGQPPTNTHNIPAGVLVAPADAWREAFYLRAMPGADRKSREQGFRRSADKLTKDKYVAAFGGQVWIV